MYQSCSFLAHSLESEAVIIHFGRLLEDGWSQALNLLLLTRPAWRKDIVSERGGGYCYVMRYGDGSTQCSGGGAFWAVMMHGLITEKVGYWTVYSHEAFSSHTSDVFIPWGWRETINGGWLETALKSLSTRC
jgi:hypothetical protein